MSSRITPVKRLLLEIGIVLAVVAVLTFPGRPVALDGIHLGMSRDEVKHRLGREPGELRWPELDWPPGSGTRVAFRNGTVDRIIGRVVVIPGVGQLVAGEPFEEVCDRLGTPDVPGCGCEGYSYKRYGLWVARDLEDQVSIDHFMLYGPEPTP